MEKPSVIINGQVFSRELFDTFMTEFKESFAHTSLSVEAAFDDINECESELNAIRNQEVYDFYRLLGRPERRKIDNYLRCSIVYYGCVNSVLPFNFNPNWTNREIAEIFHEHFKYMLEDARYVLKFDDKGNFLPGDTHREIGRLFRLAFSKKNIVDKAYNMKKDHLNAFDYARSLSDIGVPEIITINSIVNDSNPEKEVGFKHVNNVITGASFQVSDKALVPIEMQRLLAEYRQDFGLDIKDYREHGISLKERNERILKLFEKEAIFHIRFERIHPFADGNGRTGRIIMNKHLLDLGLPPVLFTDDMTDYYKKAIEQFDYEGLARFMRISSSQQLISWISQKKAGVRPVRVSPTNDQLAELVPKKEEHKTFSKQVHYY